MNLRSLDALSITQYEDKTLGVLWLENHLGVPLEFNALHDPDGSVVASAGGFSARDLSPEEVESAQPVTAVEETEDDHPAYELARKGTAVSPALAKRYDKAAALVVAGSVRRLSETEALVDGSRGERYEVSTLGSCTCKWGADYGDGTPCSHKIAARMARALNQELEPLSDEESARLDREDNRRIAEAKAARVAARGENVFNKERRQARIDGDGARQYARMAQANGCKSVPPEIYRRATGAQ